MAKKKKIKRITANPLPKYLTAPTLCQGIRERASNLDEIYDLVNRYVRILDVVRKPAEPPEKVENTLRDKIRQMREQKIIPIEPPSPDSRDLRVWLDWMQRIRLESENTIGDSNDGKTKRKTEPEKIELPENSEQSNSGKVDSPNEKSSETGQDISPSKRLGLIDWLKNHPHSYGLTGGFIFLILFLVLGLFKAQWRQWCWGVAGLAFLVLLLSLLGGRSR